MSPLRPTGRLKQQGSEAVVETAGGCQPRLVGGLQFQPGLILRGHAQSWFRSERKWYICPQDLSVSQVKSYGHTYSKLTYPLHTTVQGVVGQINRKP